jgi:uncharacterized protein
MQQITQSSSMDVETAIRAFASAGHDLPREAMRWSLDHWDEAAPGLLGVLERFADGTDRSEAAVGAAFFILHLAAERRETRAFAPLCRLLRDPEALEEVLGDGVTTTLKRILIGTYDGDLEALKGVIEAEEVDEYARAGALEVLAYLAATGRVAREEAEAYLLRLHDTLRPQHESFVWYGWTSAVALLGLEAMADVVRRAFGRGLIDPMVTNYDLFGKDLGRTLADPERMAGFRYDNIAPLEDAVGELSRWYAFSDAAKRDRTRQRQAAREVAALEPPQGPAVNPYKHVGRNDPCPCGSGKKFKKCCLPRVTAP